MGEDGGMEYWNVGVWVKKKTMIRSITAVFQRSQIYDRAD